MLHSVHIRMSLAAAFVSCSLHFPVIIKEACPQGDQSIDYCHVIRGRSTN
jgi:hypothetical protein